MPVMPSNYPGKSKERAALIRAFRLARLKRERAAEKQRVMEREAFGPRQRFNWGYHDALHEHRLGCLRALVMKGRQTTGTVSHEFDGPYFSGYAWGRRDALAGTHQTTSEPAWIEYQSGTEPMPTAEVK